MASNNKKRTGKARPGKTAATPRKKPAKPAKLQAILGKRIRASQLPGEEPLEGARLAEAASFLLEAAGQPDKGEPVIVLRSASEQKRFMRIALINDDMPFLVDSVAAAIAAHGLAIDLLVHPIVPVKRSKAGALAEIPVAAGTDMAREPDVAILGHRPPAAVRIQVEQLRARLHAFAGWQARRTADGWRIVGVECSTPREGIPFVVDGEPIQLTGRIDRIDYHPESRELLLLDYKTSDKAKSPEETHCQRRYGEIVGWVDLQLPLYEQILPHLFASGALGDVTPAAVRVGYITLPRDLEGTGERLAAWPPAAVDAALEQAYDVVRALRNNEFVYNPKVTAPYLEGSIASLLGIGYLESAAEANEEEGR